MGGICSRRYTVDISPGGNLPRLNGHFGSHEHYQSRGLSLKPQSNATPLPARANDDKQSWEPHSFSKRSTPGRVLDDRMDMGSRDPRLSMALSHKSRSTESKIGVSGKIGDTKVFEVSSLLGRAGIVGLGKAVEVLDTLGSSMTNLVIGFLFEQLGK